MSEFIKYQHVERLGNVEVTGILEGECFIFPKIDGTNGSLWWFNGLQAGSRNRKLDLENDNAGFYNSMLQCEKTKMLFHENPSIRLFGEWLVPHSLKTYNENAWRKFYVFDVMQGDNLLSYDEYKPILDKYDVEYIPPLFKITNPTEDRIYDALQKNNYLIKDGEGVGEGIVVKNYAFVNKFGKVAWAKLVTSEFKVKHAKAMGVNELKEKSRIEEVVAIDFVTKSLVDKTYAKIALENNGFSSKDIPRLLNTVFYDLIKEEMWEILKKYKNPIIDFKALHRFVVQSVKLYKPELF